MKDLIKAVRLAVNMNQKQFASALGTTRFPSIIGRTARRYQTVWHRHNYITFVGNTPLMWRDSL